MINLSFKPLRAGLAAGETSTADVLLRIAPDEAGTEARPRAPLNLAIVIDRSGSMAGRPLQEAKRCAEMILDRLALDDRLAIVAYDNEAEVLAPSLPAWQREPLLDAIWSIREVGRTNLHEGWFKGASEVAANLKPGGVARVLLLSDGCANMGQTDEDVIAGHCARLAATDVSTSTYGLGARFNEDLMSRMAQEGQGQAHYGRSAEDLIDPFQQEFDLLSALIARKLRLRLDPEAGVEVTVLNLFARDGETGAYILPDLAAGGELWAMLRLRIDPALLSSGTGSIRLLSAGLSFTATGDESRDAGPVILSLDILPREAWAALPDDPTVAARITEVTAARLAEEARLAARRGNWTRVEEIIARMREIAVGNAWVEESIRSLLALAEARDTSAFSKEARYKASRMMSRMVTAEEDSGLWSLETEQKKPSYMRKKPEEGRRFGPGDAGEGPGDCRRTFTGEMRRPPRRSLRPSLISTQSDWETAKLLFPDEKDYGGFSAVFRLDPSARVRRTNVEIDETLCNAGDGERWAIIARIAEPMSIREFVSRSRTSAAATEPEADVFLALHRNYVVLADREKSEPRLF